MDETSPPWISTFGHGRCRAVGRVAHGIGADLSVASDFDRCTIPSRGCDRRCDARSCKRPVRSVWADHELSSTIGLVQTARSVAPLWLGHALTATRS